MILNSQLQQQRNNAIAQGQGNIYPVFIDKALNAELWDVEGTRYIDFASGIAVCNTGHSHPKIVEAIQQQAAKFSHSCFMLNSYQSAVELAEQLCALTPGQTEKKAVFSTTGAEAIENAVKVARAYTGRKGVIAFKGGFHGRSNLTTAMTGKTTDYKHLFGPYVSDIYHAKYPITSHNVSVEDALSSVNELFQYSVKPNDVAAIIIEPMLGEGGFYPAPPEFLQQLRKICDQHGIVLIADEIQTGFARTGKLFACELSEIEPDIFVMAKGMAGGLPLSAIVGKAHIMDKAPKGAYGGTYAASPIACAAALAVLDVINQQQLVTKANQIGELLYTELTQLQTKLPDTVLEVRKLGSMVAIELVSNRNFTQPNAELAAKLIKHAPEFGLILLSCGYHNNVIRFLPPLTIELELLLEGLDQFKQLVEQVR